MGILFQEAVLALITNTPMAKMKCLLVLFLNPKFSDYIEVSKAKS
jgi:hypothetical protein